MIQVAQRVMLVVLDGWGVAAPSLGNAVSQASTPTIDAIERSYVAMALQASGIAVGLPWGEVGNSEVGHMNMGAGRIIYQYLPRITTEIRDGTFSKNPAFLKAVDHVKRYDSRLHIMGLLTAGSVHASIDHLSALLDVAAQNELTEVLVHLFTDGKDSGKKDARPLVEGVIKKLAPFSYTKPATIVGRVYAMDRNNDWQLTQKAYDALTSDIGIHADDPVSVLDTSYEKGVTDYEIEPVIFTQDGVPLPRIAQNDAVIFFNFREDSARQLTRAFVLPEDEFSHFPRRKINNLFFATMTEYEKGLPVEVAYPPPHIETPLAKVLADAGKTQLHIAETEKYAHVTYFFNGEHEGAFPGEERILIKSEGGPHYEKNPQMQTYKITKEVLERIEDFDFYLLNLANADMLGHLGNFEQVKHGVEILDANISALKEACEQFGVVLIITADHGNAESMREKKTGEVRTRHTGNPVPFYVVGKEYKREHHTALFDEKSSGYLADVAPTILKIMGIPQPAEMTGKPLV